MENTNEYPLTPGFLFLRRSWIFVFGILLSLCCPLFFSLSFNAKLTIAFLLFSPGLLLLVWNVNAVIILLLASTFTRFGLFNFYLSIMITPFLFVSYLITKKELSLKLPSNQHKILIPFLLWIGLTLPSLYHITKFIEWLPYFINLIAMIVATIIIYVSIQSKKQLSLILNSLLIFTALNGITVFIQSISTGGDRVFGFTGVYYIDFVNIAILISAVIIIFKKGFHKIPFLLLVIFYFSSLLLTQSRNSVISLFFSGVVLFYLLFKYNDKIKISRSLILKNSFLAIISAILLLVTLLLLFPNSADRFLELFGKNKAEASSGLVSNSLISRMLIWHTALSAFLQHPITGIGLFNFQIDSSLYHKIPNFLYKDFVWRLSPHVAYIAILTETGIIGLVGFFTFLLSLFLMNLKAFLLSKTSDQIQCSLIFLILQIYVIISMAFTDAWLWGQCGMLWSILIGMSMANFSIVQRNANSDGI